MKKITDVGIITQTADGKASLTYIAKGGRADRYHRGFETQSDAFQLMLKYHFKGLEFGNWENPRKRNYDIEKAVSELPELARIMHSLNLGMDKQIGVAFGARGMGGRAAAHYEPALNMINLTKTKGYGSLAHEYGHALDYNFGSFIDQNKDYAALSGGSSVTCSMPPGNTGCQFRALTNQIIDSICNGSNYQKMLQLAVGDYWFRRTEIFARFFEQYVAYKLHKNNSYAGMLCNTWAAYLSSPVYVAEPDFMKVLPLMDKLIAEMGKCMNSKTTYKLVKTPYLAPVIKPTGAAKLPTAKKGEAKKVAAKSKTASKKAKLITTTK